MRFERALIEQYAGHLDRKAGARVTGLTLLGALVGAFLGGMPLFSLLHTAVPHRYGYALLIAGAAAGGYLGFSIGESRAAGLRLQVQMALHQLRLEELLARLEEIPAAEPAEPPANVPPPTLVAPPVEWSAPPASVVRTSP